MVIKNEDGNVSIQFGEGSIIADKIADKKKEALHERIVAVTESTTFALLIVLYVCLGLILGAWGWRSRCGYNAWAVFWPLMLLGDVPASVLRCVYRKQFSSFSIFALCTAVYCFVGMYTGIWHPYWVILLAIPIYYMIFNPIDRLMKDHRNGLI